MFRSAIVGLASFLSVTALTGCEIAAIQVMNRLELTRFSAQGDKLYIADVLNSKTFGQMKEEIAANPEVDTLVFTSMEGSIDDETTFAMGRWVREQGLNTHLTSQSAIASGAVDLFLSGVERTMERGAKVGVHSWSDGQREAADFPRDSEEHDLNKNYIVDMGVSADFYWFTIYQAPAAEIYWMTDEEITEHGLLTTDIVDTDTSADIPFEEYAAMRSEVVE